MATPSTSAATSNSKAPVALITAGSAGLGAAGARLFATNGYRVIVNYNSNTARAEALLAELHTISGGATTATDSLSSTCGSTLHKLIKADMGDRAQIQALVAETVAFAGGIDVIFSNQGYTHIRGWESLDDNIFEDDWDRCFNVNVKSHLWLLHAARPYLDQVEGCMVVTSSLAGIKPGGSSLAYSVTKAALNHLVKGLAVLAAPKIRVNAVCPGLMLTDWGLNFSKEVQEANIARTKLKRVVTPEETAEQVLCFARSKGVTGVNAVIDAGWSL
ncbi:hypothetical protein PpBr36_07725 [Pyricularia pennisetigena]|uniref:hypothetical protein n=1 Tax=Pyricularia pennisetigena TaxID=1578925 RepID=UPI00115384A0|nr:hypothetical protein PpBr36_07725 [Pyricularia pennisetigena]TLS26029.1 hypothetical protein PpBr36_07725 [Pyricularia pennisetigena]